MKKEWKFAIQQLHLHTMGQEIERKFLVDALAWARVQKPAGVTIRQGYLFNEGNKSCRVRISGDDAWLNIKQKIDEVHRAEYEYTISLNDAQELLMTMCESAIEKTRYRFPAGKHTWEVDVFEGANKGLVVAEIELNDAQEIFEKPEWIAEEVTHDERYLNTNLAIKPFSGWGNLHPA